MKNHINQKQWNIAIIGGGPAGASTAISFYQALNNLLPQNEIEQLCQVHLFDYPANSELTRSKTRVGETIPPAATPVLRKLGLFETVTKGDVHLDCVGSISVWNDEKPGYNDFLLDIVGRGYHLERQIFDAQLLAKACQLGVTLHTGCKLTSVNAHSERHQLKFLVNKNTSSMIAADFVIDASGKSSAFARRLNIYRNVLDEVIFLCVFIQLTDECDLNSHTLVESVADGWWYAARLPNNKMIVTFCTDQQNIKSQQLQRPENWLKLLAQTSWLKDKLGQEFANLSADSINIVIQSAPSSLLSAVCGDNWLAVGDAASSYDPITSAGITKAMQQGESAGRALASLVSQGSSALLEAYQKQVFADFTQYAGVRNELYASEKRFSDADFWQRRLGII